MGSQIIRTIDERALVATENNITNYMPVPPMASDEYFNSTIKDASRAEYEENDYDLMSNEVVNFDCSSSIEATGEDKLFTAIDPNYQILSSGDEHRSLQLRYTANGCKKIILGNDNLHTYHDKKYVWVKPVGVQFSTLSYVARTTIMNMAMLFKKPNDFKLYKANLTDIIDFNNNKVVFGNKLSPLENDNMNFKAYPSRECITYIKNNKLTWVGLYIDLENDRSGALDIYNLRPILSDPISYVSYSLGILPKPHTLKSREETYSLVL